MKKILTFMVVVLLILGVAGFISKNINKEYIISFNTDSLTVINEQKVKKGNIISNPGIPVKEGYEFLYWELNGKEYNFTEKIEGNLQLNAIWKKQDIYSYSIETSDEEEISKVLIYKNGSEVTKEIDSLYDINKETIGKYDENHNAIIVEKEQTDKIDSIKEGEKYIEITPKKDEKEEIISIDPREKDYGNETTE